MSKARVLVIDDEADNRMMARVCLQSMGGYEVLLASDGRAGLEMARHERPAAILMDVVMPGMDGPATFRALQADDATRAIPVIFMTGRTEEEDLAEFRTLGVHGLVLKPFDAKTLLQEVRRHLGSHADL